jgi:Tfp pilus assembly PilM family ATPase
MQWFRQANRFLVRPRRRTSVWGALLDQQEILLVALALQKAGAVRVMVYEHQHAPEGLVHLSARDDWLVQALRGLGKHLPAPQRTMALALDEARCRQGVFGHAGAVGAQLQAEVQLEAASAWGVAPEAVGFDFQVHEQEVHWAACLHEDVQQWRRHARAAGWRLPVVEPGPQAARRAVLHWRGDVGKQWAQSPQDWQFSRTPEREATDVDWSQLQGSPLWRPLVACGAALRVLV